MWGLIEKSLIFSGKIGKTSKNGNGWDRARTGDLGIFSATLYQLSYPAECCKLGNLPPMSRDFKSAEALSAASSESKHSQVFWQSRSFGPVGAEESGYSLMTFVLAPRKNR